MSECGSQYQTTTRLVRADIKPKPNTQKVQKNADRTTQNMRKCLRETPIFRQQTDRYTVIKDDGLLIPFPSLAALGCLAVLKNVISTRMTVSVFQTFRVFGPCFWTPVVTFFRFVFSNLNFCISTKRCACTRSQSCLIKRKGDLTALLTHRKQTPLANQVACKLSSKVQNGWAVRSSDKE